MKTLILVLMCTIGANLVVGQNAEYTALIKKADSLYRAKDYLHSALMYSDAFRANGWKGYSTDRYNSACSWALANVPDSSFFQLDRIASKANYTNYGHLSTDPDLNSLHDDARWAVLLDKVKQNKEKAEINFDKPLVRLLDTIYNEDQQYRLQINAIEEKYGWQSKELMDHWKLIQEKDSVNLLKVKDILDKRGWLGPDVIGAQGSSTLFLVIQHADISTQESYLPMMREAVLKKNASPSDLALLEDRVALRRGKKQVYGSQIAQDPETHLYFVSPLDDPDHVDQRRAEVGLQPLADYLTHWQIKWDVEQYKKDLPMYEVLAKKNQY